MTKLIFLGSGSAFTVGEDNFQSNILVKSDRAKNLLIDCGSDIRFSLHQFNLSYLDISHIYISHLHADHIGGLEYIGFNTKFDPRCNRPHLYLSQELESELWERSLSGGMRSIQGEIANLESFFEVHPINLNRHFIWENIKFNLIKVVHIDNGYFVMPSYGLLFEADNIKIFISTDTQLSNNLYEIYDQADVIFQDCELSNYASGVHAHYNQLVKLDSEIKAKMWLYGYQSQTLPDAKGQGFCGFVKRGQIFDLKTIYSELASCSNNC